jgi:hypothetical protein
VGGAVWHVPATHEPKPVQQSPSPLHGPPVPEQHTCTEYGSDGICASLMPEQQGPSMSASAPGPKHAMQVPVPISQTVPLPHGD